MKINIIGAGNTGKTLGRLIVTHNAADIESVYNTTPENNQAAIRFIGQGHAATDYQHIKPADLTIISTPDDYIESTCNELVKANAIKAGSAVIHLSGIQSSDALNHALTLNCNIASLHPMKSFANPEIAVNTFANTYCALEGSPAAIQLITPLLKKIGANPFQINKTKKALYHAAGVFASNYLVTLYQTALDCLTESGIEIDTAQDITMSLMQGTVNNLTQIKSAKQALTGPLKRGDLNTVRQHLIHLNPEQRELYTILATNTLPLTSSKTDHLNTLKTKLLI